MLNYSELLKSNTETNNAKSFTDGLAKLSTDDLLRCGKPVHMIEINEWEYNKKVCHSCRFKEFEGFYWNCGKTVSDFIQKLVEYLGSIEEVNKELIVNPPAMKFSKVKTKSGFMCVVFEIVAEDAPF